jgi:hypothetical protein
MIYIGIYLALVTSVLFSQGKPDLQRQLALWWAAFFLPFIGLRRWVGCDYGGYLVIWNSTMYGNPWYSGEPGFALLLWGVQQLGLDYSILNLLAAALFLFGMIKLALREPNPLAIVALSFPIIIVHLAMSAIRQAIALAFVMIAYRFVVERRGILFAIFVLLAGSFHYTALVFLPMLALAFQKRSPFLLGALAVLWIAGVAYMGPQTVEVYRSRYLAAAAGAEPTAAGGIFRAAAVSAAGVIFFLYAQNRWKTVFPQDFVIIRYFAGATLLLVPLTVLSSVIGDRIGYYLMPAQAIIFARLPFLERVRSQPHWTAVPYIILFTFLVVWIWLSPLAGICYTPYDNHLFGGDGQPE